MKSEFVKRKEKLGNLKMGLVVVVDTEDIAYKKCVNSIIEMYKISIQNKDINNAHFIINGIAVQSA